MTGLAYSVRHSAEVPIPNPIQWQGQQQNTSPPTNIRRSNYSAHCTLNKADGMFHTRWPATVTCQRDEFLLTARHVTCECVAWP